MKTIYKIAIWLLSLVMIISLSNCASEDEEYIFVHDTNTISQMVCKASHSGSEFIGEIYEFTKDGVQVEANFTQKEIEGGYGLILFPISQSLEKDVDLTNIYLKATLTYDEFVTPSLSGRHNITGEGIIISVKSGVGTTRKYRVRGYYE